MKKIKHCASSPCEILISTKHIFSTHSHVFLYNVWLRQVYPDCIMCSFSSQYLRLCVHWSFALTLDPWPPHSLAAPSWLFCLASTSGLESVSFLLFCLGLVISQKTILLHVWAELLTSAVCVVWSGLLGFRLMLIWVIERTFVCQLDYYAH